MSGRGIALGWGLVLAIGLALAFAVTLGETAFSGPQYVEGLTRWSSDEAVVLWQVRAPRAVCALAVGAALGLSGAVLQGLLRNPLADPGVLGVSATAALGAALAIVLGAAAIPGAVEGAALIGAGLAGLLLIAVAARLTSPEGLVLFGVALTSLAGALTSLIFNLSPSPIAQAEVMGWLLGSVQNRSWIDVAWVTPPVLIAGGLALASSQGLRMLALGEEAAATSGLAMGRMKVLALIAASVAAGAAVAVAGVIGFVGLAAPHLVRGAVRGDPGRLLLPSALTGGLMLVVADLLARLIPTDQELKLGVFTALVGAPLFALIAWRAAREWPVVIALEGVSAEIAGRPVLSGLSLAVGPGEIMALCGPNGAGKSSVIRAACGLLPTSAGAVRLAGETIGTLSERERAARLAYLPQERRIAWNMPAVEIAALGQPFLRGDEARRRALEALVEMEAGHLADRGVAEMSGGERARVLIARTLATGAAALALDEPVAGLDPDAQFLVMERLRAQAEAGRGVLISLHDLSLAADRADRVVVVDGGAVVADGAPKVALSAEVLADVFKVRGDWENGRLQIGGRGTL